MTHCGRRDPLPTKGPLFFSFLSSLFLRVHIFASPIIKVTYNHQHQHLASIINRIAITSPTNCFLSLCIPTTSRFNLEPISSWSLPPWYLHPSTWLIKRCLEDHLPPRILLLLHLRGHHEMFYPRSRHQITSNPYYLPPGPWPISKCPEKEPSSPKHHIRLHLRFSHLLHMLYHRKIFLHLYQSRIYQLTRQQDLVKAYHMQERFLRGEIYHRVQKNFWLIIRMRWPSRWMLRLKWRR